MGTNKHQQVRKKLEKIATVPYFFFFLFVIFLSFLRMANFKIKLLVATVAFLLSLCAETKPAPDSSLAAKRASLAKVADGSKKTAMLNIVKRAAKHQAQRMAAPQSLPCEAGCVPPVDPPPFDGVSSELSISRSADEEKVLNQADQMDTDTEGKSLGQADETYHYGQADETYRYGQADETYHYGQADQYGQVPYGQADQYFGE